MTRLIDDILMISRLESGGAQAELKDIRTLEIAREAASSVEGMAKERRIQVETDADDFLICADARQMEELFTNLLSNAVKYNLDGEGVAFPEKRAEGYGSDRFRQRSGNSEGEPWADF